MELALELGWPAEMLARVMSERELSRWKAFYRKKLFATERLELYLAQLTHVVAVTMGGSKAKMIDFMFKPVEPERELTAKELKEAAREAFKFKPRRKKAKDGSS